MKQSQPQTRQQTELKKPCGNEQQQNQRPQSTVLRQISHTSNNVFGFGN